MCRYGRFVSNGDRSRQASSSVQCVSTRAVMAPRRICLHMAPRLPMAASVWGDTSHRTFQKVMANGLLLPLLSRASLRSFKVCDVQSSFQVQEEGRAEECRRVQMPCHERTRAKHPRDRSDFVSIFRAATQVGQRARGATSSRFGDPNAAQREVSLVVIV